MMVGQTKNTKNNRSSTKRKEGTFIGVEIEGVLYPFSQIECRAATQEEVDRENALILEAIVDGYKIP